MNYLRILFLLLVAVIHHGLFAQTGTLVDFGGPMYIERSNEVPEGLAMSRSVVMISVPAETNEFRLQGKWKKLAEEVHKTFRKVGIDAIVYVNHDDLNSGPEILSSYTSLFSSRKVENLISVEKSDATDYPYKVTITSMGEDGKITQGQKGWIERSGELSSIMLRLARQILRQGLERENFLIPEYPEFLDDLAVFSGNRLENFPSRLQSLPIAVPSFKKVSTKGVNDPEVLKEIDAYNQEVDRKNQELKEIMKIYPFKYELVENTDNEWLYKNGFQYALMPISTSGKSAKKILNYQTSPSETDYMTTGFDITGKQMLMKVPIEAMVTKYYIKQTIVKDIHSGDYWDAGLTWQEGLKTFIRHLRIAFRLSPVE